MARTIRRPSSVIPGSTAEYHVYNGLDCLVTAEVFENLMDQASPEALRIYRWQMACQNMAMAAQLRGILVDDQARTEAMVDLAKDERKAIADLNGLHGAIWDRYDKVTKGCTSESGRHKWPRGEPDETRKCELCGKARMAKTKVNPHSTYDCARLFYDLLGAQVVRNREGGRTTDKEALEKIEVRQPKLASTVEAVRGGRFARKMHGVLKSGISPDGRFHFSLNVGGTYTGRWSSNEDCFGYGTNAQNITEKLRRVFIADPGKELFYADLAQAESRCVAYLAEDQGYIDAHIYGDVHTNVCRLIWPELPWTGDDARDHEIADGTMADFDPEHSYRWHSKRAQHGLNYGLSYKGLARIVHIKEAAAADIRRRYFAQFPGLPVWHKSCATTLAAVGELTTPLGRTCQFLGRLWDPATIRQAIAYVPQSMVGDILNIGLYRVWHDLDPDRLQVLGQVHDAILGQTAKGDSATIEEVKARMVFPIPVMGRVMEIPVDCKRGPNWRDMK